MCVCVCLCVCACKIYISISQNYHHSIRILFVNASRDFCKQLLQYFKIFIIICECVEKTKNRKNIDACICTTCTPYNVYLQLVQTSCNRVAGWPTASKLWLSYLYVCIYIYIHIYLELYTVHQDINLISNHLYFYLQFNICLAV